MIRIFTGDDRARAHKEIEKLLGDNYEIVEGYDLDLKDLPSLFLGNSLFFESRNILIRDISLNKAVFEKLPEYLETPHNIILFELKLDKRSAVYKAIKDKIEIREFALPKNPNFGVVFDIYKTAKQDGKKAVNQLEKIKDDEDPMMFFGLIVSQAIKDFSNNPDTKQKRVLEELSKVDLEMKSTPFSPWLLIESFLVRLSSL